MLDILVPTPIANAELVPDAIRELGKHTDFPFRLVVMVDGGLRKDFEALETFLHGIDHPWKLLHNNPSVGLNQTLRESLEECTSSKLVAIMAPEIRLMDAQWFGKMQMVFHRDPICGIADTWPNTKSTTLHPVRRAHNNPTSEGCRFAIVQTAFARKTPPYGDADPMTHWSRSCMGNGGSSWAIPGVRYTEAEHVKHEHGRVTVAQRG